MKVIIAGSRSITSYAIVRDAVIASCLWSRVGNQLEIVSGGARGVDRLGEDFANRNGLKIHRFIPDWNGEHKKAAGMIRNIEMGKFSDGLIAIWDGQSRGTKQMIDWSKQNGLFVYVHQVMP